MGATLSRRSIGGRRGSWRATAKVRGRTSLPPLPLLPLLPLLLLLSLPLLSLPLLSLPLLPLLSLPLLSLSLPLLSLPLLSLPLLSLLLLSLLPLLSRCCRCCCAPVRATRRRTRPEQGAAALPRNSSHASVEPWSRPVTGRKRVSSPRRESIRPAGAGARAATSCGFESSGA